MKYRYQPLREVPVKLDHGIPQTFDSDEGIAEKSSIGQKLIATPIERIHQVVHDARKRDLPSLQIKHCRRVPKALLVQYVRLMGMPLVADVSAKDPTVNKLEEHFDTSVAEDA